MDLEELRACRSAVITIADAAALLGIDARTVSRAVQSGELPALRVGRRLLIPRLPLLARLGVIDSGNGAQQDASTVEGAKAENLRTPEGRHAPAPPPPEAADYSRRPWIAAAPRVRLVRHGTAISTMSPLFP
jgi:excisionase family DNA binding protein